ncbi:uncharacterized protein LOC5518644 [Nematostella vectensis]|uniref:uncharacterized protein LOC5518644 n=1 Tax=Nematostella vectensis TaxID=45351 RepID=UPI0020777989|nr:uncharacterized protein LOC5518644 [Nematostella vectensis]
MGLSESKIHYSTEAHGRVNITAFRLSYSFANMKFAVLCLALLAVLPAAYSIKCYVCTDEKANCNKNEVDCSVAGESYKYCLKVKTGDAVTKSCAKQTQCDTFKSTCDKSDGKCVAACCNDKDLCNSGLTTKPMMLMSLLMPILLLVRSM